MGDILLLSTNCWFVQMWDLSENTSLFSRPAGGNGEYNAHTHLAQTATLLGPPPDEIIKRERLFRNHLLERPITNMRVYTYRNMNKFWEGPFFNDQSRAFANWNSKGIQLLTWNRPYNSCRSRRNTKISRHSDWNERCRKGRISRLCIRDDSLVTRKEEISQGVIGASDVWWIGQETSRTFLSDGTNECSTTPNPVVQEFTYCEVLNKCETELMSISLVIPPLYGWLSIHPLCSISYLSLR